MNKTTLYLPEETQRRLRVASRRSGRPQADLIRQALDHFLDAEPEALPKSIGVASDPELRAPESKDWLRKSWHPG